MKLGTILSAPALFAISACATADFQVPTWKAESSTSSRSDVGTFLRGHVAAYDTMISELEQGKVALEWPVVPLAVVGATAVALGGAGDVPIVFGGAAAGFTGASNYVRPRDRLGFVVQARAAAVCVHREFEDQVRLAVGFGYLVPLPIPTSAGGKTRTAEEAAYDDARARGGSSVALAEGTIPDLGPVTTQITDVGSIAVVGAEEVVTKLKLRLANIGTAPDYSTILAELQARYATAGDTTSVAVSKRTDLNKNGTFRGPTDAQLKRMAEYSARVAECVAKVP